MPLTARGVGVPEVTILVAATFVSYVGTALGLQAGAGQAGGLDVRQWATLIFYVLATAGCGTFFTWMVGRLDKLRAHEHRQNNSMAIVILMGEQHADDLAEIRRVLGIPRP